MTDVTIGGMTNAGRSLAVNDKLEIETVGGAGRNLTGQQIIDGVAVNIQLPIVVATIDVNPVLPNVIYVANSSSAINFILPTTYTTDDTFYFRGMGTGGFYVSQNATGQLITIGNATTTSGIGGSVQSSDPGDELKLQCMVDDTWLKATNAIGNFLLRGGLVTGNSINSGQALDPTSSPSFTALEILNSLAISGALANLYCGPNSLNPSAMFQVDSSTHGSIPTPRMSDASFAALLGFTAGLQAWGLTSNRLLIYDGSAIQSVAWLTDIPVTSTFALKATNLNVGGRILGGGDLSTSRTFTLNPYDMYAQPINETTTARILGITDAQCIIQTTGTGGDCLITIPSDGTADIPPGSEFAVINQQGSTRLTSVAVQPGASLIGKLPNVGNNGVFAFLKVDAGLWMVTLDYESTTVLLSFTWSATTVTNKIVSLLKDRGSVQVETPNLAINKGSAGSGTVSASGPIPARFFPAAATATVIVIALASSPNIGLLIIDTSGNITIKSTTQGSFSTTEVDSSPATLTYII